VAIGRAAAHRGGEGGPVSEEPRRIGRRALFGRLLPSASETGQWLKVHRNAMACRFEVTLDSADARHVDAARAALDEVDAIEASLTVFRETSEVSLVNRQAGVAPVPVSPGLFALLALCRELHRATGGAFDPASTALSRCWGFLDRRPQLPTEEEIAAARARSGMDKVVLDDMGRAVRFAVPGVEIGFGAVGKGWALDRIAASLRARRVPRALLTAGGSSHRGWGGEKWELALRPGLDDLGLLRLRDAALGTSASGEQHFDADGRRFGHVLDPRTGWPAEGVRSASVLASEAAVADALSTAFLVGGPALARPFCAARPGTMALLVLDAEPRQILVFGQRDGAVVEPADGVRLVAATS
jgi:FAD:protein FMN transferase